MDGRLHSHLCDLIEIYYDHWNISWHQNIVRLVVTAICSLQLIEYVLFHVLVELFLFGSKKCIICRTKLKLQIGVFPVNESCYVVEGAFSILQHFLATETCFKKCFLCHLKALFVLKIFKFLSWLFGHLEKGLHYKDKVNIKIYDITTWKTNNCNGHIAQYLKR